MRSNNITITFGLFFTVVSAAFSLTSCSEKTSGDNIANDVAKFNDIDVSAGDEGVFEFTAASVWTLTSDKNWCIIDTQTGQPGPQNVHYRITDYNMDFDEPSVATVTLSAGDFRKSIKVTRNVPAGRSIGFYQQTFDEDGNEVLTETDELSLLYAENAHDYRAVMYAKANFKWMIREYPEWLKDFGGSGNAGELSPGFSIIGNIEKFTAGDMAGEIIITDQDNRDVSFSLPVTCPGTDGMMIPVDCPLFLNFKKTGEYKPDMTVPEPIYQYDLRFIASDKGLSLVAVAAAYDDEGNLRFGEIQDDESVIYDASWAEPQTPVATKVGDTAAEYLCTLKLDENAGDNRIAILFAIPLSATDGKQVGKPSDIMADGTVKEEFMAYKMSEIKQDGANGVMFMYPEDAIKAGAVLRRMRSTDTYYYLGDQFGTDQMFVLSYRDEKSQRMAHLTSWFIDEMIAEETSPRYEFFPSDSKSWIKPYISDEPVSILIQAETKTGMVKENAVVCKDMEGNPLCIIQVNLNYVK